MTRGILSCYQDTKEIVMKTFRMCFFITAAIIAFPAALALYASDSSDAEMLRQRCEKELKTLEVCVMNFGDTGDQSKYATGVKEIKLAKVRITQSKFKEAIEKYNGYLKLQNEIYKSLAEKYLARTQTMNDTIAEELADSIDTPKVDDYFKLAYRNLEDAKTAMTRGYYLQTIEACRRSKQYSLGAYTLVKKPAPDAYKTDIADNDGKIANPKKTE
jgi:hypothetical protein